MSVEFYIGKRLSYDGRLCTVRYYGEVQGTKGEWLGVEWDDPTRGKHAGEHQGVKYFECKHTFLFLSKHSPFFIILNECLVLRISTLITPSTPSFAPKYILYSPQHVTCSK
jgi:dynactin complex subunit